MPTGFTHSVSIAARAQVVLEFLADPRELPRWAPVFARAVRPDGDRWIVDTGQGETAIRVRVSREHGTVDFLDADAPAGTDRGAFTRVVGNRRESQLMFTRFFPATTSADEVERQKAVVDQELRTVQSLCEAANPLTSGYDAV